MMHKLSLSFYSAASAIPEWHRYAIRTCALSNIPAQLHYLDLPSSHLESFIACPSFPEARAPDPLLLKSGAWTFREALHCCICIHILLLVPGFEVLFHFQIRHRCVSFQFHHFGRISTPFTARTVSDCSRRHLLYYGVYFDSESSPYSKQWRPPWQRLPHRGP